MHHTYLANMIENSAFLFLSDTPKPPILSLFVFESSSSFRFSNDTLILTFFTNSFAEKL